MIEQAKAEGWRLSEELKGIVRAKCSCLFGTKCIEDSFHEGRALERQGGNNNGRVRPVRFLHRLLHKKVLSCRHKYGELRWKAARRIRGKIAQRTKSHFFPKLQVLSPRLRAVRSVTSTTPWSAPAPLFLVAQDFELELAKQLRDKDFWLSARTAWLSTMVIGQGLMVIRKKTQGGAFFFVLGHYPGDAVVGWPTKCLLVDGMQFYQLERRVAVQDLRICFLTHLDAWEPMQLEVVSPVYMHCVSPSSGAHMFGLLLRPLSQPIGVAQCCARTAFGTLSRSQLAAIARYLGIRSVKGESLSVLLRRMLMELIPKISEQEFLQIIERRVRPTDQVADLMSDDFDHLVNEKDREQVKDFRKHMQCAGEENRELSKALSERKKALQPPHPAAGQRAVRVNLKSFPSGRLAAPVIDSDVCDASLNPFLPEASEFGRTASTADGKSSRASSAYGRSLGTATATSSRPSWCCRRLGA